MFLDIKAITEKYHIETKHIVHAGAHHGQELEIYDGLNPDEVWLFEPQKEAFSFLRNSSNQFRWAKCYHLALGSQVGTSKIYKSHSNTGESSSLLPPHKHLEHFPTVTFGGEENVQVETLDNLIELNSLFVPSVLCMDTQGYEMEILRGASKTLSSVKLIITEFSTKEMYKGCPLLSDMDEFLLKQGFNRIETFWQDDCWGDAAYVKV